MNQTCPNCGSQNEQGNAFCNVCGTNIAPSSSALVTCPKCGKRFPRGLKFCDVDGSLLYDPLNEMPTAHQAKNEDGGTFSRTLLLIFVISYAAIALIETLIRLTTDYSSSLRNLLNIIWIMDWSTQLLIPLVIKKLPLKIIGFIITVPIVLLNVYLILKEIF